MVHKIQLVLSIEVESDETKEVIEERINSVNTDTLIGSFDETLDEFGEVTSIEVE